MRYTLKYRGNAGLPNMPVAPVYQMQSRPETLEDAEALVAKLKPVFPNNKYYIELNKKTVKEI